MQYRGHRLSANVSMLFTELPYLDRFAGAARFGFDQVESWWPFPTATPSATEIDLLVTAIESAGISLGALNFFGGDIAAGERGRPADPTVRRSWPQTWTRSWRSPSGPGAGCSTCCTGNSTTGGHRPSRRLRQLCAIRSAASAVSALGGIVLLEPLTEGLNGRYPLLTADDVLELIDGPLKDVDNVSLLFDTFHLGSNGVDLVATASAVGSTLAHVQVADSPGRGEPGYGCPAHRRDAGRLEGGGLPRLGGLRVQADHRHRRQPRLDPLIA